MDKKLIILVVVFFLSFALFTSILVFNQSIINLARAKEELTPSSQNSLIILSCVPPVVPADGHTSCNINVFIRSGGANPRPLSNKVVSVTTTWGQLKVVSDTTDNQGNTLFSISASTAGTAVISAQVAGDSGPIALNRTVSVEFK